MFYQLSYFLSFSITAFLALLVYTNNKHQRANLVFTYLLVFVAGWIATLYLFYSFHHPFWVLVFGRFNFAFTIPLASAVYYFSLIFPDSSPHPSRPKILTWLLTETIILTLITIFTPLIDQEEIINGASRSTVYGPLYPLFVAHFLLCFVAAVYNLAQKYRRLTGISRFQLHYIILGIVFSSLLGATTNIFIPSLTGYYDIQNLGVIAPIVFASFSAYAIVKHRLLDTHMLVGEITAKFITSLAVCFLLSFFIYIYLANAKTQINPLAFPLVFFAAVALTYLYPKINRFSAITTNRLFFRSVYDYQKTLSRLSQSLSTFLEMPQLVDTVVQTLIVTMNLDRVAVLVKNFDTGIYEIQKTIGFDETNGISLVKDNYLTDFLSQNQKILVLEEIEKRLLETTNHRQQTALSSLINHMRHIEAGLVIPVIKSNNLISLIVLGNKKNQDPYSVQDIALLQEISLQAAVAIENAMLYRKVNQFNHELQTKIQLATRQLRRQNLKLQKANQELKSLDKMKDQLIAVTSHELRTPASIVKNYLWLLINQPEPQTKITPKDLQRLQRCFVGTQDLIQLINETLDASKLEGGKLEVSRQPVNVKDIVDQSIVDLKPKIKDRGLKLIVKPIPKTLQVQADPTRLREVLTNLVVNAIKYTSSGSITISTQKTSHRLVFSVQDTGRGIAQENLPKLFTKFFREDSSLSSSNPQTGGTGLGLYLTKSLVELMKGKIWVKSKQNVGSTFFFSLPLCLKKI